MAKDEELRRRIVDVAADLFAEHGYEGTRVSMVAEAADVPVRTVKRLTGGRSQLFAAVMNEKVRSDAAQRIAEAALHPSLEPALSVLLETGLGVFTAPARSWDILELEAITRAHRDHSMRLVESERVGQRWSNARSVVRTLRESGVLDKDVDDEALTHFVLAISVGMAMIDPVLATRPRAEDWSALIGRIGLSMAPPELLVGPEHPANVPWRVRIDLPDQPGSVGRLTRALGALHAYTVGTQVVEVREETRTIDLALLAPEGVDPETILAVVGAVGRHAFIAPGSLDDALDLPTRVLDGATALVASPGWAPQTVADLVGADRVEVIDAGEGRDDRANVLRLQWTPERHVLLTRSWAPFARAEQTRASALLRLSAAIATVTGDTDALGWVEPIKGTTVWIRLAHPEDAEAVAAMHARSSERTRYLRYVSLGEWRDVQLRRLAGGHRGATLVAMSEDGAIVALGNVFPADEGEQASPASAVPDAPDGPVRAAEIAVIIEDAYQGRGLGTVLLRHQLALAQRMGFTEVVAVVLAENTSMLHLLRRTGLTWHETIEAGTATWRATLPALVATGNGDPPAWPDPEAGAPADPPAVPSGPAPMPRHAFPG